MGPTKHKLFYRQKKNNEKNYGLKNKDEYTACTHFALHLLCSIFLCFFVFFILFPIF